jgi:pimeloyl-ACP methyl ester carboxylesterase
MQLSPYHPFRSAEARTEYLAHYDKRAELWPVASQSTTVATSYGETFVRVSGPDHAPPLALLPGASGNSLTWLPNIAALSERHRTYAVDNIYDYGRSVYTRHIYGPAGFVNWLDELFTGLEPGNKVDLVGLSYGGWLASLYALRFPDRVSKVVLLAPAATVLPIRRDLWLRVIVSRLPHPFFARNFMCWMLGARDEKSRSSADGAARRLRLARRCFKRRRTVIPTVLADEELRSISVPTLFLVSEHEMLYSPRAAVLRIERVAPHIQTGIIPEAGHDMWFAQSELVNRSILEFLDQP